MSVQNVDGVTELISLINFDLAAVDEATEVGVWLGGGVEFSR